jgi:hypothetical protein
MQPYIHIERSHGRQVHFFTLQLYRAPLTGRRDRRQATCSGVCTFALTAHLLRATADGGQGDQALEKVGPHADNSPTHAHSRPPQPALFKLPLPQTGRRRGKP